MVLTLFHDFTSPASAVAVARVQRLADEGLPVEFAGFEVLGVDAPLPVTVDVIAAIDQLQEAAAHEGLTMRRPRFLPPTGLAHLVADLAQTLDLGASWRETAYRAFWEDGADLSDPATLIDLGRSAGFEEAALRQVLTDRTALARTRRAMGNHRRNGVGGVPTVLAQRTLVPGLVPLDDLRELALL